MANGIAESTKDEEDVDPSEEAIAEAKRMAADTVFEGVHKMFLTGVKAGGGFYEHRRIQEWDKTIRGIHGFSGTEVLKAHEDPLVASFYTMFDRHLDTPIIGQRTSPWA